MKRNFSQRDGGVHTPDGIVVSFSNYFGDGKDESRLREDLRHVVAGTHGYLVGLFDRFPRHRKRAPPRLLYELTMGRWTASRELVPYAADDAVRGVLIEAVRSVPAPFLMHPARALGFVGGQGAREVLQDRFHEIARIPRENAAPFLVEATEAVAAALLRIDPNATDAARALVSEFACEDEDVRYTAVQDAVSLLRPEILNAAMTVLASALSGLRESDDTLAFLFAAPALARAHFHEIRRRCAKYLDSDDLEVRQWAAVALARTPPPATAEALAILANWVPRGDPIGLALWVASLVWPFLEQDEIVQLLRRGLAAESPNIRGESLILTRQRDDDTARVLIEEALRDEPDPILRKNMERALEGRHT
ncbi:MAG: hypothetical protein IT372_33220 [Polyangiaceae bacterium]|nr:hypothetical protein [Polyangiaceae bacterium]